MKCKKYSCECGRCCGQDCRLHKGADGWCWDACAHRRKRKPIPTTPSRKSKKDSKECTCGFDEAKTNPKRVIADLKKCPKHSDWVKPQKPSERIRTQADCKERFDSSGDDPIARLAQGILDYLDEQEG
jgi:hypothetical protein